MTIPQSQGKIYVSSQRGITQQGNDYRSYHTFNRGTYFAQHKEAVGNLLFFNDDTLNGGAHTTTWVQQGTSLLLLPVVGGIAYKGESNGFVEAGQACLLHPVKDIAVEISNPYRNELVNFFQIGLQVSIEPVKGSVGVFDLEMYPNCLLPMLFYENRNSNIVLGSIGKFGGRQSGSYTLKNPTAGVFAFVIEGVLEVEDRLLESRDGLALWGVEEVAFEALSPEAILLLLAMDTQPEVVR